MEYMARHGTKRTRPAELEPGTQRVISVRMDYIPPGTANAWDVLGDTEAGYVSRYALGRDYHKLMRNRLQKLAERIHGVVGDFGYRAYVDSAPVLEKALARNAGLGWIGKHTVLINRHAGSYFFLGELYTDLPLPVDAPASAHCGSCARCIEVCPTQAILGPYRLDAKRCISYLTIELKGSIPEELRPLIGNRIYGCDDCQLACPWNKFARRAVLPDFDERNGLGAASLVELFGWEEEEFNRRMEGSPIRRIGHERWLRNLAVGMGNAATAAASADPAKGDPRIVAALRARLDHPSALVREHVRWALDRHEA
jgi:epoxyqueuosine reductase